MIGSFLLKELNQFWINSFPYHVFHAAWKRFVFGVFLLIPKPFPRSHWIKVNLNTVSPNAGKTCTRKTLNSNTFYRVTMFGKAAEFTKMDQNYPVISFTQNNGKAKLRIQNYIQHCKLWQNPKFKIGFLWNFTIVSALYLI